MTDRLLPFRRSEQDQRPDETLVAACAKGDNNALEELFRRHGANVHSIFVRLRCIDPSDLDDVVQTTFLEVKRSASRFAGRASVGTWILGIAMNVMRHYVRAEARRRSALSAAAAASISTDDRRLDDQIGHRQALGRVQAGFDALPPGLRMVFTLCDLAGMKSIDVARVLEIPEGTVWRRLHQARVRLRKAVNEEKRK